jgi:soluble lytic murein transglycosylase
VYHKMRPVYRQGPDGQFYAVDMGQGAAPSFTNDDWNSGTPIGGQPGGQPPFGGKVVGNLDHITMMAESRGNPNAVSPKGARGLMQVMPGTARDPGFGIRPSNGTPADDVRVGKEYRAKMQTRYGGNLAKMWGAYNWGPGNVDKAIAEHGEGWFNHAPAETRNYIARNIRAATRGR